jgi:hypothetical protein
MALVAFGILLAGSLPGPAQARHNMGYKCYACHSLSSADIRPGSNSVRKDQQVLGTIPPSGIAWTGGNPVSCDFCHTSAGDIPKLKFQSKIGQGGSAHPVDTIGFDCTANPREITCNDCHNGPPPPKGDSPDVTPFSLLSSNATDGYPDHRNVVAGLGYGPSLAKDNAHLTQPYWSGSSLPGVSSANDTAFWQAVRVGSQTILCWSCHDGSQSAPFTLVKSIRVIRADYIDSSGADNTKGHRIKSSMGRLGSGSALPCYDCHDSHGTVNKRLILDSQSAYGSVTSSLGPGLTNFDGANDRVVCAGCHDTGLAATAAGTRVEGLAPVDPFNSVGTALLHIQAGIADNLTASTRNCLSANNGCHTNAHDPSVPCTACHAPGGTGPTVVWPSGNRPAYPASAVQGQYGSHLVVRSDDPAFSSATDWNGQCNKCHTGHAGPVRIPLPSSAYTDGVGNGGLNMQTILGFGYLGADNVRLGGTVAAGATEARLCWNCHYNDTAGVASHMAEFGPDNPGNTYYTPYNYGTLNSWNATDNGGWYAADGTTPATWTSGNAGVFAYKTGPLKSMHSTAMVGAAPLATRPGLKPLGTIRCSYCHDVHDLNRALRTIGVNSYGDNVSGETGPPFLRGRWRSNPYKEDGAPQPGMTSYDPSFGAVPRGGVGSAEPGGYQIDNNNGRPTAGWGVQSSGLCMLCHGDNIDDMNQFGVDENGIAQTPAQSWLGPNGHSNAVIGGTRKNAFNVYNEDVRKPASRYAPRDGQEYYMTGSPNMAYQQSPCGSWQAGFRSWYGIGWNLSPTVVNVWESCGYNWGATVDNITIDNNYHNFPCSKCHNPHASRLPRLMITNCLDTKHNGWDSSGGVAVLPAAGTMNMWQVGTPVSPENGNVTFSNATSAQNCHRLKKPAFNNAGGDGWNKVTPW